MNLIEHLTKPKIGFYCLDIVPFDSNTFYHQIVLIIQLLFLLLNFMNNNLITYYKPFQ